MVIFDQAVYYRQQLCVKYLEKRALKGKSNFRLKVNKQMRNFFLPYWNVWLGLLKRIFLTEFEIFFGSSITDFIAISREPVVTKLVIAENAKFLI